MQASRTKTLLRRMRIIFRVNNEHRVPSPQSHIGSHRRQPVIETVIKRPRNMRRTRLNFWMLLAVVLQNKLLVQAAHILLVQELGEPSIPAFIGVQKPRVKRFATSSPQATWECRNQRQLPLTDKNIACFWSFGLT